MFQDLYLETNGTVYLVTQHHVQENRILKSRLIIRWSLVLFFQSVNEGLSCPIDGETLLYALLGCSWVSVAFLVMWPMHLIIWPGKRHLVNRHNDTLLLCFFWLMWMIKTSPKNTDFSHHTQCNSCLLSLCPWWVILSSLWSAGYVTGRHCTWVASWITSGLGPSCQEK